jgi:hypothetical protein
MARITDSELVALLERAFTRSRSDDATNRPVGEAAAVAAATVARALREAGLIVIREERRRRPTEDLLIGMHAIDTADAH